MGIAPHDAVDGLMSFRAWPTGWRRSAKLGRVRFVNDNKATNADAARQAMSSYPRFYWIAGGVPKAGGIDDLVDLFPRVAGAYLIGQAAEDFGKTLEGQAPVRQCGDIEAAVAAAYAGRRRFGRGGHRPALARLRLVRPVRRLRAAGRGLPRGGERGWAKRLLRQAGLIPTSAHPGEAGTKRRLSGEGAVRGSIGPGRS